MLHKYCRYIPLFSDNKRCDCKSNQIPQIQLHLLKGYIRRGHQSLSKSHEIRTKARRHKETICLQEALNWYSNQLKPIMAEKNLICRNGTFSRREKSL